MIQIIKVVLPIVVAFFIGIICKKYRIIDDNGNKQIKNLLIEMIIPFALFNSLISSTFSMKSLLYIFTIFSAMLLTYFLANICKRFYLKDYQKYFPEMMVTWEGGTLGISLCSLLLGQFGLSTMAIFDLGCAFVLFGIIVPILKVKDGTKFKPKDIIKLVLSSKAFLGIILGAICGALGLGKLIFGNEVLNAIYHGIFDIIISATNILIMITIGYSLKVNKALLKPVITTCICRLLFMSLAFLYSAFVIFRFTVFDKKTLFVLAIAFSLPESYGLPLFSDLGNKEYLSTTLSFMTIICLIIFVIISTIATMIGVI